MATTTLQPLKCFGSHVEDSTVTHSQHIWVPKLAMVSFLLFAEKRKHSVVNKIRICKIIDLHGLIMCLVQCVSEGVVETGRLGPGPPESLETRRILFECTIYVLIY